jgi:acyl carrier protein phosphodiesterase
MNYLGHAFLSFGNSETLTGNMIGDHVKGRIALAEYPEGIRHGIELHRKIDEFTDNHPATTRAKLIFREDYGLYAGAITDTVFDHFLANDPKYFASADALLQFTQTVYQMLEEHKEHFPPGFAAYFPYMSTQNWLYGYRSMKGVEKSLQGLQRRAAHMPPSDKAYTTFVTGFYHLNQCYYELIDDIIKFVKTSAS